MQNAIQSTGQPNVQLTIQNSTVDNIIIPNIVLPSINIDALLNEIRLSKKSNDTFLKNFSSNSNDEKKTNSICQDIKNYLDFTRKTQALISIIKDNLNTVETEMLASVKPINDIIYKINQIVESSQVFLLTKKEIYTYSELICSNKSINYKSLADYIINTNKQLKNKTFYEFLPCVIELRDKFQITLNTIKKTLLDKFKQFKLENLHDLANIIEVLGNEFKQEFISTFVKLQLTDYKTMFNNDKWTVGDLQLRFDWLRKILLNIKDYNFPLEWKLTEQIINEYCNITRDLLILYIQNTADDIAYIINIWKLTAVFEKEIDKFGIMSSVFMIKCEQYLQMERKNLNTILQNLWKASNDTSVFDNHADLFLHIKKSVQRGICLNYPGSSLLMHLFKIYNESINSYFKYYAECRDYVKTINLYGNSISTLESFYKYYEEVVGDRYELQIKKDKDTLLETIHKYISNQINLLVKSISLDLFSVNVTFKPNQNGIETNSWVALFIHKWEKNIKTIRESMMQNYYILFMNNLIKEFIDHLRKHIVPTNLLIGNFNEHMAEQAMVDITTIKNILLGCVINTTHYNIIQNIFTPLMAELQILSTPEDKFLSIFLSLITKLDTKRNIEEYLKYLMDVRGFKYKKKNQLLEALKSTKQQIVI